MQIKFVINLGENYLCTDASYTPLSPATDSSDTAADTHATFGTDPSIIFTARKMQKQKG